MARRSLLVGVVGHHVENVALAFEAKRLDTNTYRPDWDAIHLLRRHAASFDLLIAFPPCKYLCSSGLHWNTRRPERAQLTTDALLLVRSLLDLPIPRIALENPVGCISTRIRPYDQLIQPYRFGHDASKKTCLWLKNLPPLAPTHYIPPRLVVDPRTGKTVERWGNQFDSGQNNQINAPDRALARAERWAGVAQAMAAQWGALL